jgi:uncharacterized membrane protein
MSRMHTPSGPATPPRATTAVDTAATLPLSPRAAMLLAYSAGWLSGWLVLTLEGQRLEVRRHAAQALLGFGGLTLVSLAVLTVAGVSLFVSIGVFRALLWLAQGVILMGVGFWLFALVQTARGANWRWPLIAGRADHLASLSRR